MTVIRLRCLPSFCLEGLFWPRYKPLRIEAHNGRIKSHLTMAGQVAALQCNHSMITPYASILIKIKSTSSFYCLSPSSQILPPDKTFTWATKKSVKYKSGNETRTLSKDTSIEMGWEAESIDETRLKKETEFGVFMPRSIQSESQIHWGYLEFHF